MDLAGVNLSDFLNPLSAPVKLARLVVKVWSDMFSENVRIISLKQNILSPRVVALQIDPHQPPWPHFFDVENHEVRYGRRDGSQTVLLGLRR